MLLSTIFNKNCGKQQQNRPNTTRGSVHQQTSYPSVTTLKHPNNRWEEVPVCIPAHRHITVTPSENSASFVGTTGTTSIPPSGFCPHEGAERGSRPPAPNLPASAASAASQGPARRSLSSLPQRPLFIPAKTKPKVYSSHPRHPKHPDIHQRYHFRLL